MQCRFCNYESLKVFLDLNTSALSNAYLSCEELSKGETWYPLKLFVCENCWLVQSQDFVTGKEIFVKDYAYFSSFSKSWLKHCQEYAENIIERFKLDSQSLVVEVAANDGGLLKFFQEKEIQCFGVEPAMDVAQSARLKGVKIITEFFNELTASHIAKEKGKADLIIANNVLAHNDDIIDFVMGFSKLLKPEGFATFEFPHLLEMIRFTQFDTVYHEHFSYLSLITVSSVFAKCGLNIFDVEKINTHGGSLRVYAQKSDTGLNKESKSISLIISEEKNFGLTKIATYKKYQEQVDNIKFEFLSFLLEKKKLGKKVAAYGAAAKGNTFLNYLGIKSDLIDFVIDRNPAKQGKFLPGSRIPIMNEDYLKKEPPHYLVVLPWNIKSEVFSQLDYFSKNGGKFVTAIPKLEII